MVFKFPENLEQDFIKRVVAIPGDTLDVVDGRPVINGWIVPSCYVGKFEHDGKDGKLYVEYLHDTAFFALYSWTKHEEPGGPSDRTCQTAHDCTNGESCYVGLCGKLHQGPYRVASDQVWVMGDNRNNSHDSRSWKANQGGGVPFENIKGRAMFVFATFGSGGAFTERFLVNVMGRPKLPSSAAALQPALDKCLRDVPDKAIPPPGR
jgi:signal peptidase I